MIDVSEELVASQTLPVRLREVALLRRVKKVTFCPMLQAGLTAAERDGFSIFIKCEPALVEDWTHRWSDPADGGRSLPTRTRFSIAHELGHTLFFDTSQERIKMLAGASSQKIKPSLESLCNIAASRILLPERLLRAAARAPGGGCNLLDPAVLVSLRRHAAISPRALILRIAQSQIWSELNALISCVRVEAGEAVIEEAIIPTWLKGLFPLAKHGQPARCLTNDPLLAFNGGSEKRATVEIEDPARSRRQRTYLPFVFNCERIYERVSGYFVTAECTGPRRIEKKPGDHDL